MRFFFSPQNPSRWIASSIKKKLFPKRWRGAAAAAAREGMWGTESLGIQWWRSRRRHGHERSRGASGRARSPRSARLRRLRGAPGPPPRRFSHRAARCRSIPRPLLVCVLNPLMEFTPGAATMSLWGNSPSDCSSLALTDLNGHRYDKELRNSPPGARHKQEVEQ